MGRLTLSFWAAATGVVVLYVFFVFLARVQTAEVAGLTALVLALAVITLLRNLRVSRQLAERGGNPQLRRARNRIRERRGF